MAQYRYADDYVAFARKVYTGVLLWFGFFALIVAAGGTHFAFTLHERVLGFSIPAPVWFVIGILPFVFMMTPVAGGLICYYRLLVAGSRFDLSEDELVWYIDKKYRRRRFDLKTIREVSVDREPLAYGQRIRIVDGRGWTFAFPEFQDTESFLEKIQTRIRVEVTRSEGTLRLRTLLGKIFCVLCLVPFFYMQFKVCVYFFHYFAETIR